MHGPEEGDMTPGQLCPHRAALEVTPQGAAASGMGCGWAGCPTKQGWQRGKWHKEEGNGAGGVDAAGEAAEREKGKGREREGGGQQGREAGHYKSNRQAPLAAQSEGARKLVWTRQQEPGGEPAARRHARTVAGESTELPLPALGPLEGREERWSQVSSSERGQAADAFAASRPPLPPPLNSPRASRRGTEEEEGGLEGERRSAPHPSRGARWQPPRRGPGAGGVRGRRWRFGPAPSQPRGEGTGRDGTGPGGAGRLGRRLDGRREGRGEPRGGRGHGGGGGSWSRGHPHPLARRR